MKDIINKFKKRVNELKDRVDYIDVSIDTCYFSNQYRLEDFSDMVVDIFTGEIEKVELYFCLVIEYEIDIIEQKHRVKEYIHRRTFEQKMRMDYDSYSKNYENNIMLMERINYLLDNNLEFSLNLNYVNQRNNRVINICKNEINIFDINIQEYIDDLIIEEVKKGLTTITVRKVDIRNKYAHEEKDIYVFK